MHRDFSNIHHKIKMVLHLKKVESPSPKDALCQVWLKLAQWFWRRNFFNFFNVFSLFCNYLPLKKAGPFIWTKLNPLYPGILSAKFGSNCPSGSGEDENVKSLQTDRRTDRQTDDVRQVIRKAHLSFQRRWAKNCSSYFEMLSKRIAAGRMS